MKRIIDYFFILLLTLVILLSLMGYLGKYHIYFENLTNFKLQLFLVALIPCFFFILRRRPIWLVISLLCVLLNLYEIVPWYFPTASVANSNSEPPIRIFLFNVLHQNTQYEEAISLVNTEKPTIAVFLEATKPWPKELAVLQKTFPYHLSAEKLQIEIYSTVELGKVSIQSGGTYRGFVTSEVEIDKQEIIFIAAHTYPQLYFGQEGFEIRNQQLKAMGNYVKNTLKPVILVGDLNATMWSPYYQEMVKNSGLRDTRTGFGILPTQSFLSPERPWLSIPLDHCLVSSDFQVTNLRTGNDIGSDHLPLITDLKL